MEGAAPPVLPAHPGQPNNPVPSISSISPGKIGIGGGDFTLTDNGSGFVSSSVVQWNGTALPTTFLSTSNQIEATVSASDIAVRAMVQVTVSNPSPGGGTSGAVTFFIGTFPRFAYVQQAFEDTISMFTVDAATGQLRHNGYVPTGDTPTSAAIDPANRFVYVANAGSGNSISAFTIDAGTGTLTSVGTVAAGTTPRSVAVDPSGQFVYAANQASDDVSAYTINDVTGALTSIGPFLAGTDPLWVTIDPSGRFVYVANRGSDNVSAFEINAGTGDLRRREP